MGPSKQSLIFNGVNGATGSYLLPEMTVEEISRLARGETLPEAHAEDLQIRSFLQSQRTFRIAADHDPKDLGQAGWGVLFAQGADPAIRDALAELLEHRRSAASSISEHRYREFSGHDGYLPGESAYDFLARFGAGPGPANPDKVPYYILIVGDPETIPFSFQYQLDVERAVGRIHFDSLEEYARYARSVVTAEIGTARPRRAVFFGVRNNDDPATEMSHNDLVLPLAKSIAGKRDQWQVETVEGPGQATKSRLAELVGGADAPALLFTASHGMGFPLDDPRLLSHQGALLCQDWPGPEHHHGAIPEDFYFAGDDIGDDAHLLGMIAFHFACYGAGTPRLDDFGHYTCEEVAPVAPHAFVAALPRRLLGHPNGGALAVVGHVERAWGYSFHWPVAGPQIDVFESALLQLMDGMPIGAALEFFNGRYAELSTILTQEINAIKQQNLIPNDVKLAGIWIANNDARGYAIIGDPAVRLPSADAAGVTRRQAIDPVTTIAGNTPHGMPKGGGVAEPPEAQLPYDGSHDDDDVNGELPGNLVTALEKIASRVSAALDAMLGDGIGIHVETYTSDDLSQVGYDPATRRLTGPLTARAITHVNRDGDTFVVVPGDAAEVDETVWRQHAEAVRQAQAYRAELIRTATASVAALLGTQVKE